MRLPIHSSAHWKYLIYLAASGKNMGKRGVCIPAAYSIYLGTRRNVRLRITCSPIRWRTPSLHGLSGRALRQQQGRRLGCMQTIGRRLKLRAIRSGHPSNSVLSRMKVNLIEICLSPDRCPACCTASPHNTLLSRLPMVHR